MVSSIVVELNKHRPTISTAAVLLIAFLVDKRLKD